MTHPLASEIPSVQDLTQEHEDYMSRLADSEREQFDTFTGSLNMPALMNIASSALGSECCSIDKIYQGRMGLFSMNDIFADFYLPGGFNQVSCTVLLFTIVLNACSDFQSIISK
jgi:hypothetical protein